MAAVDTLDDLTTKVAEKLNALYAQIGDRAMIGVSSDSGNLLSTGSDQRPYFDGSNIAIGVSANAGNDLTLGTDNKPYLANDKYVPLTRQLSVGIGLNPIGDLSEDRTVSLDLDYLDSRYSAGYKQRGAVRVATASNITLSGLQTIDGVAVVAGNRVLVRAQTDASENGIWVVAAGAWTRATDFDEPVLGEVEQGAAVFVEEGALLDKTGWTLKTPPPYVMGTTELEFDQYAGASSYVGGNLITINGNQINHDTGSWTAKSNLSGATVISNLSVDAYGHPTNWTVRNLTPSNIGAEPSFSKNTAFNKNFGTSAGTVAQGNHTHTTSDITNLSSYTGFDSRYYTETEADGAFLHSTVSDIKTNGYTRFIPAVQWGENAEVNTNYMSGDNQWRLDFPTNAFVRWRNSGFGDAFTMDISNGNFYASGTGTYANGLSITGGHINMSDFRRVNFGSSQDAYMVYDGSGNRFNMVLESSVNDFRVLDGTNERFKIDRATGNTNVSGTGTFGGDVEVPNNSWYMGGSTRLLRSTNSGWVNIGDTPPTITLYAQNEVRLKNFTPITDDSGYQYMNMTSGGFLRIGYGNPGAVTIFGGSSPRYNNGTNNYDLYHAGNLRSDSQNDSRYVNNTGSETMTGYLRFTDNTALQFGSDNDSQLSYGSTNDDFRLDGGKIFKIRNAGFGTAFEFNPSTGNMFASGTITASNLSGTNTGDQTWSTLGGKPSTFTPSAHTHSASDITSGTLANARISQSSVTQHNSAINAGMVDGYHIWSGTQAAYDAIATKDSNTLYFIT